MELRCRYRLKSRHHSYTMERVVDLPFTPFIGLIISGKNGWESFTIGSLIYDLATRQFVASRYSAFPDYADEQAEVDNLVENGWELIDTRPIRERR